MGSYVVFRPRFYRLGRTRCCTGRTAMGDNVVWQVEDIADYRNMARAFVEQARSQHFRVVYLRFGQHPPILDPGPEIIEYQLDAALGFETFSSQIHNIATQEGSGYVMCLTAFPTCCRPGLPT